MGKKIRKQGIQPGADTAEGKRNGRGPRQFSIKMWGAALVVGLITFAVFLPSLNNGFVNWDDDMFIYNNAEITSVSFDFFKWAFTNRDYQWTPLRWISHAVDYAMWGLKPAGHHLTAVVLHGLNAFLVVILVVKLLEAGKPKMRSLPAGEEERKFRRRALVAGAVTGLLFGIHPLRVESVVWVSSRKDVLYAFFFLLSLISYLRYCALADKKGRAVFYILTLVFFIMSVMSKAAAVALPLVLVLLDIYPLGRIDVRPDWSAWRRVFMEKLPFFAVSGAVTLINIGVHEELGAIVPLEKVSFADRILLALKALGLYFTKMVWPSPLTPFYRESDRVSLSSLGDIGLLLLVAGVTALCIFLWRRGKRVWLTVFGYYVIMLLPVLVVRTWEGFVHDRYSYMLSVGPFLLAGLGTALLVEKIGGRRSSPNIVRVAVFLVPLLVFSLLGALTLRQTKLWKDSLTFWTTVAAGYPMTVMTGMNRAEAYALSGKHQYAINELNRAIEIDPTYWGSYNNRGLSYIEMGEYHSAIRDFTKTIELEPMLAEAYGNRALAYIKLGDYQAALQDMDRAMERKMKPVRRTKLYVNRCELHIQLKHYEEAVLDCTKGIEMQPNNVRAYKGRGVAYSFSGKKEEAMRDYRMAARLGDVKMQEFLKAKGIGW
jgi:Flp pilus assembly protein TadD